MITINNNMYVLDTDNTSYAFAVLGSGQLEHLTGNKCRQDIGKALAILYR